MAVLFARGAGKRRRTVRSDIMIGIGRAAEPGYRDGTDDGYRYETDVHTSHYNLEWNREQDRVMATGT